jgi:predicted transcriptional regulator/transcriptional regulator with XRE-family HTH domain
MAADLGISPSYIALLEGNQRPLTADLLLKLAQIYRLDIAALASERSDEFAARLAAALRDPMFSDLDLVSTEIEDFSNSFPGTAEALLRLYTAYQEGQMALADQSGGSAIAADPVAEVRRFLSARHNSFPALDDEAEALAAKIAAAGGFTEYLAERRVKVRRLPSDVMTGSTRRFDQHRGEIVLDERLDKASAAFQLALQIAYLDLHAAIEGALSGTRFDGVNTERLARRALANYAAGALMMPYRAFVKAAEARRYDVEALSRLFGASFEQVAHRLTTLQKPGMEGVPFFFIRVDAAGNVSKRLDGAGFPFARHGGSCPLWSLHQAFCSPRQILTQWVELPDGERFFSIVRTVTAGGGAHDAPRIERAIALGCASKHAHRLVYTQGRNLAEEAPTPIGVSCRLCHRVDCIARAEPPIGRQLLADDFRRTAAPFGLADR